MIVVLSGVETNNKGAELMLYAILQEIERIDKRAVVYIGHSMVRQGLDYIKTDLDLRFIPTNGIASFLQKVKISSVLNRLGLFSAWLNNLIPIKGADFFIDGSGLLFSDSRIRSRGVSFMWEILLKGYKKEGTKIVFLPQAFGPFNEKESAACMKVIAKYADVLFARDKQSYDYLLPFSESSLPVLQFPDFTSCVKGVIPDSVSFLTDAVCIIPNSKMIRQTSIDDYLRIIHSVFQLVEGHGYKAFLLNHEGNEDQRLISEYKMKYNPSAIIVNGLNALEVKGVISMAYLVVSSRFHGVVSSLNCCVPCLSTSWHHKYAELYKDYGVESGILPMDDEKARDEMIVDYLTTQKNKDIRKRLSITSEVIKQKTSKMWEIVWE